MKSYNHKCIKVCSSMKVSLLYLCIDYHSLSLTDDVYSLFHLQYTMALILIIIIFIIIRMYLLTTVIIMLMIPMQQALSPFQLPCSEYTNAHA